MRALVDAAAGYDVVLLHENEKEIYGDIPDRVLDLVESVDSPQFKLAWDAANYVQCGVRPFTEGYDRLRPHLAYIQIKDALAATGEVVPAGEGDGELRRDDPRAAGRRLRRVLLHGATPGQHPQLGRLHRCRLLRPRHEGLHTMLDSEGIEYV